MCSKQYYQELCHHLPCNLSWICSHNKFAECQANVCGCDINFDLGQGVKGIKPHHDTHLPTAEDSLKPER